MSKVAGKLVIKAYDDGSASISIDTKGDIGNCNLAMIAALCTVLEDDDTNLLKHWIEGACLVKDIREEQQKKKKKKSKSNA